MRTEILPYVMRRPQSEAEFQHVRTYVGASAFASGSRPVLRNTAPVIDACGRYSAQLLNSDSNRLQRLVRILLRTFGFFPTCDVIRGECNRTQTSAELRPSTTCGMHGDSCILNTMNAAALPRWQR